MTDIRRLYGETRALIQQQQPSQELFFELCEVVAQAWEHDDAQTMAEFFPFVDESLRNWPDHLRTCPPFWEDHFRTKPHYEAYEPLQLIRRIVFSNAWKTTRIRGFGKSRLAASIRHITLPPYKGGNATRLRELCHATMFGFVRELHIVERPGRTTRHDWLTGLLEWPANRGTTMLKLHHYRGGQEEPGAMLGFGDSFPDLEEFWLMHTRLSSETLSEMLSGPALTKLTEIDLGYCDISGDLSVNLRAGRLIVRNASGQEMTNLLGAGWMSHIKELKLEKCHTSDVEHALNDFFARATELTSLTLQKCHVSEEFAEAITAHKRDTLRWLSGKKLNFQGDAKRILQTASWQCMESLKLK